MHKQLWGYKVEEKIYNGVRERKRLNITAIETKVDTVGVFSIGVFFAAFDLMCCHVLTEKCSEMSRQRHVR